MIVSPQAVQDLQAQFQQDFAVAFGKRTDRWSAKAYRAQSNAYRTVHHWLAAQPEMRKWVGARIINNLISRGFELKNEDWEYTFGVDANDIFYDNIGAYEDRGRIAGEVSGRWYEKLVTDAMLAGTTTLCWDGQYFYDTDHPNNIDDSGAGTFANLFTALPLTADNLWTLCATMMAYKNENGLPMEVVPGILEVPPQLGKKAYEAVAAPIGAAIIKNVAATENVAAAGVSNMLSTAIQSIGGVLEVVINPRLASAPNDYYIHSTNLLKPFVIQVAKDPAGLYLMESTNPGDRELAHNKRFVWGTDAKGVAAGTLPFLSIKASQV